MTTTERIDAATENLKKLMKTGTANGAIEVWETRFGENYRVASLSMNDCETILEALRFQKAALGEPSEAVIVAAWESQFKSVGATDEEAKMLGKKRYEDQKHISIPAYKAMIAELSKQVKENDR